MNYIDMSVICNLIGKAIGIALLVLATYITPKVVEWLEQMMIDKAAWDLVNAAEQTIKGGTLKKDFVMDIIRALFPKKNLLYLDSVVEGMVHVLKGKKEEPVEEKKAIGFNTEEVCEKTITTGCIPMNEPSVPYVTETAEGVCEDCIVRLD